MGDGVIFLWQVCLLKYMCYLRRLWRLFLLLLAECERFQRVAYLLPIWYRSLDSSLSLGGKSLLLRAVILVQIYFVRVT